MGLDPHVFVDALADTPLASPYAVAKATAMLTGELRPGFPLRHAFKDVRSRARGGARARRRAAADRCARPPLGARRSPTGYGDEDVASVVAEASTNHTGR